MSQISDLGRFLLCAWVFATFVDSSSGVDTFWTNPGQGDWFTPGNWSAGVPDLTKRAIISNQGTSNIVAANAEAQFVDVGLIGTPSNLRLSSFFGIPATLQTIATTLYSGNITVEGGSEISNVSRIEVYGTSTINVSGSNSEILAAAFVLGVVDFDNVILSVTSGGKLTQTSNASESVLASRGSGAVTIQDPGSNWTNAGSLTVGRFGIGSLTVRSGAKVTTNGEAYLAEGQSSTGTVTVEGIGSSWEVLNPVNVGLAGIGKLVLKEGGSASNTLTRIGPLGEVEFGPAGVSSGNLFTSAILNNGSLRFSTSDNVGLSALISGAGNVYQSGPGSTTLSGLASYQGGITVDQGVLVVQGMASATSMTANTGVLRFQNGNVDMLGNTIRAESGTFVEYDNSSIKRGFLRGAGIHSVLNGGTSSFSELTTFTSTTILQNGWANFNNFLHGGYLESNNVAGFDGFTNAASGRIEVNSDLSTQDFVTYGVVNINSTGTLNNSVSEFVAGGGSRTTVASGGTLNIFGTTTMELNGALLVNNGDITGTVNVNYGSLAKGTGNYDVVNVNEGGVFAPGTSPGITTATELTLDNAPLNSGSPRLVMELAGTTAGIEYDQLQVSGQLSLGGTLDVVLLPGFTPSDGQSFDLLDWGSRVGMFNTLNLPSLSGGLSWNISQLYTTGVLSIGTTLSGDFDQDGDVDGHDFLIWQRGGSPNGINSGDLALWQAQYGTPPLASLLAVPEPKSWLLLLLVGGIAIGRIEMNSRP